VAKPEWKWNGDVAELSIAGIAPAWRHRGRHPRPGDWLGIIEPYRHGWTECRAVSGAWMIAWWIPYASPGNSGAGIINHNGELVGVLSGWYRIWGRTWLWVTLL